DVGDVAHQTQVHQLADPLLAQALDVQRAAAGEVLDAAGRPGRAGDVHAAGVGLALRPDQRLAAHRAVLWEPPRLALGIPVGEHGAEDLGDDVAGPADDDGVARAHVLGPDLVLVVEGGLPHRDAAHEDGLEHGVGRGPTGAAHRHLDVEQLGGALLGRELVGDGPAGGLGGEAEVGPASDVVDLHDDAVDLVAEVVPLLLGAAAVLVDAGQRVDHL